MYKFHESATSEDGIVCLKVHSTGIMKYYTQIHLFFFLLHAFSLYMDGIHTIAYLTIKNDKDIAYKCF